MVVPTADISNRFAADVMEKLIRILVSLVYG